MKTSIINALMRKAVSNIAISVTIEEAQGITEAYSVKDSVSFTTNNGMSFKLIDWSKLAVGSNDIILTYQAPVTSSMSNQQFRENHGKRV